jgi:hypothetical protein
MIFNRLFSAPRALERIFLACAFDFICLWERRRASEFTERNSRG